MPTSLTPATSTTLSTAAKQGDTYLRIAAEYLTDSIGGIAGTCTIGGVSYTFTSPSAYAINVTPVSGGVGLQADAAVGTAVTAS